MAHFNAEKYPDPVTRLLIPQKHQALGPGKPDATVRSALESLSVDTAFADSDIVDADMAMGCITGLWLYHDFLDESHALSQRIATSTGSYWHGIMHRREPDPSNAAYWFRRVGEHSVFRRLRDETASLMDAVADPETEFLSTQTEWDPFAFIDLCEVARIGRNGCANLCQEIQRVEFELLFDFCYDAAIGA